MCMMRWDSARSGGAYYQPAIATLLSCPHAGRYADVLGPKAQTLVFGLCGCFADRLPAGVIIASARR